ncbi:hypothetical protein SSTG_05398 [Streptomyces sp. e14]|uniref:DUF2180 family protein n=1 Tax=Streptomyces sp. e14 TaxID=645465 RepID=UPI0001D06736|nr:DUF2180 family protein [Streptomyces sp. e14]EFF89528.1 hypothetical protein SSTG_05398 [Streptomyces sp. e14]MYX46702.1 DUF2180 family protein [Streptomyces sp. SID89]NED77956.1 DUF2180 family protein [Streptomyces sp. SID9944]
MNCFDCRAEATTAATDETATEASAAVAVTATEATPAVSVTAAVAVCRVCGAGICHRHAHTRPQILHRAAGTGVTTEPRAARRLLCGACAVAERSG